MASFKSIANQAPRECYYVQTAAAGTAPPAFIFVNPSGSGEYFEVVEAKALWDVNGGAAAAANVKRVPAATALASGTSVLASTFDLTTGARTSVDRAMHATNNRIIAPGESVAVETSGTLTGLTGLVVHVTLKPTRVR